MLASRRTPSARIVALATVCVLGLGLVIAVPTVAIASDADYRQVVDITFPVLGPNSYIDDYHQPRGGGTRYHQATDIMAEYGQQVHAAVGGTITTMTGVNDDPPSWGYAIYIRGDDGRTYVYIHLGRQDGPASEAYAEGLARGDRVERGQHIGYVGHSGNAHPDWPHLHFEIHDAQVDDPYGQHRINPYNSLKDAEARGDLPSSAPLVPPLPRLQGQNRIDTALALSTWAFADARTVVLASSRDFPDGLAAGPLAGALGAPLLLTPPDRLPARVASHIRALGAERAIIVGGEGAVAPQVVDDVRSGTGILADRIVRIGGKDRYETAALIAEKVLAETSTDAVMLAVGRDFPDALAASAYGASSGTPVMLVSGNDLPGATRGVLESRDWAGGVHIVGGEAVISEDLRAEIASAARASVTRVHGADRYGTAAAVADLANGSNSAHPRVALFATGSNWPDALAAGPAVANRGSGFLLVHPRTLSRSDATERWLVENELDEGWVIGGTAAVSDDVARQLASLLR